MEVVSAVPEFNFDSNCSSPYMTAPSSPQRFGNFYFSAPASPTRISAFYRDLDDASLATATVPPGINGQLDNIENCKTDCDFEFIFSGPLERTSLSADELFDGGKIRPLKLPLSGYDSSTPSTPRKSPKWRSRARREVFHSAIENNKEEKLHNYSELRGRERSNRLDSSSYSDISSSMRTAHKGSRSLSPMRVSDIICSQEESDHYQNPNKISSPGSASFTSSFLAAISFSKGYYKKWNLKNFLLFRSASEGRATVKEQFTKYSVLSKKEETAEDVKNSSFRSTDSTGSSRRRGQAVSAHEIHYTMNRAVSEELKRKTFLPYKQGLLGCLGFSPGGVHDISIRGIGSLPRG